MKNVLVVRVEKIGNLLLDVNVQQDIFKLEINVIK